MEMLQNAKMVSISILVISLPLLYVSLLHVPPSNLFKDSTFWFLVSNSIVVIVAADSGAFSSSHDTQDDVYDEFIKRSTGNNLEQFVMEKENQEVVKNIIIDSSNESRHDQKVAITSQESRDAILNRPVTSNETRVGLKETTTTKFGRSGSDPPDVTRRKTVRRTAAVERRCRVEESDLSKEELNRKVEEFIRRFNREIRLQAIMT